MKTQLKFSLLLFFLACTNICMYSQSRRLVKHAEELEENGMFEEAADNYYQALNHESDNIKALIGLKRTAPKVIQKKLNEINLAFSNQDYQKTIDKYKNASTYQSKIERVGINLEIENTYIEKFNISNDQLAEKYYSNGKTQFDYGNYEAAISDLERCLSYRPYYKDASTLVINAKDAKNNALAERYYNSGLMKYNATNYREAYYDFEKCLTYKPSFKDAVSYSRNSLDKGKVRIGIFEFKNDTRVYNAQNTLYSYVVTNAVNYNSPFIEVIDRDNLERLLKEQRLGLSGVVDEASASKVGKVLGLNYVVLGRLINVTQTGGNINTKQINAYELYGATASDGKKYFKGNPTTFNLCEGSSTVTFEASYQVISVETSKIITSNIVSASDEDYVKYATYRGDYKKLCAINPDASAVMQILAVKSMIDQSLFTARQTMKNPDEMQTDIIKNLASQISTRICRQFD